MTNQTDRDRIITALYDARRHGLGGMSEAEAVGHMADAVLAALPAASSAGQAPATDRAAVPTDEDFLVAIEEALESTLLPSPGVSVLERTLDAVTGALAPLVAQLRAAVLPAPTDQTAVTCSVQHHRFDDGRLCIRAAQHSGDHIDERGYHWSDTVAVYPLADGQFRTGANVRDALRRMAGKAQQAPADRATLSEAERTMLTYALNQAQLRIWSVGGVTDEEQAAVTSLRRLADTAPQDDYEATTGHAITCGAGFGMGCQCTDSGAQQDQAAVSTADKAEALGMTPTEYRGESHRLGEQKIREAVRWLRADVAFRVLDALDGAQQRPAREARQDPTQDGTFVPPAAEGLPLAALDSARSGATMLDAWAETPNGRNFLAHALVQLARDGWLRTEPGEGFEPVRDRDDVPEPQDPASVARPGQPETDTQPADTAQQPKEA